MIRTKCIHQTHTNNIQNDINPEFDELKAICIEFSQTFTRKCTEIYG